MNKENMFKKDDLFLILPIVCLILLIVFLVLSFTTSIDVSKIFVYIASFAFIFSFSFSMLKKKIRFNRLVEYFSMYYIIVYLVSYFQDTEISFIELVISGLIFMVIFNAIFMSLENRAEDKRRGK